MELNIQMKCERNVQLKFTHFPNFLRKVKQDAYSQGADQAVTKKVREVQRKSVDDVCAVPVRASALSSLPVASVHQSTLSSPQPREAGKLGSDFTQIWH